VTLPGNARQTAHERLKRTACRRQIAIHSHRGRLMLLPVRVDDEHVAQTAGRDRKRAGSPLPCTGQCALEHVCRTIGSDRLA
jgi:hypothetical protein